MSSEPCLAALDRDQPCSSNSDNLAQTNPAVARAPDRKTSAQIIGGKVRSFFGRFNPKPKPKQPRMGNGASNSPKAQKKVSDDASSKSDRSKGGGKSVTPTRGLANSPSQEPLGAMKVQIGNRIYELAQLEKLMPELEQQLRQKEQLLHEKAAVISKQEITINEQQLKLESLQSQVDFLQAECDKLRSVLAQTGFEDQPKQSKSSGEVNAQLQQDSSMNGQVQQPQQLAPSSMMKKQAVSAESDMFRTANVKLVHHKKSANAKQQIRDAICHNDFLKHLDQEQVLEMVECMYEKQVPQQCWVIREGEAGAHLYVASEGELEVTKDGKHLGKMGAGRVFGELAILYNCTRTASVKAVTLTKLWVLDRAVFQLITMRMGLQRQTMLKNFLTQVPLFKALPPERVAKIADTLEEDFYSEGTYIVREGEKGDRFFIISNGQVRITQLIEGRDEPQDIRQLNKGDYFGEKALLGEEKRTASVIALAPGVEVLTLDRESFQKLIGDLAEIKQKDYGDEERGARSVGGKRKSEKDSGFEGRGRASTFSGSPQAGDSRKTPSAATRTLEELLKPTSPSSAQGRQLHPRSATASGYTETPPSPQPPGPPQIDQEFQQLQISNLNSIATLGVGGFGRVELVHLVGDKSRSFALKAMKKKHIVDTRQQEHIFSERNIMLEVRHQFIVKLFCTFRDRKFVYMLMEACLGGELWTLLRDRGHFDDMVARFYAACVIEALEYLHKRSIVYRDLKPENCLLDTTGYLKIVDFGFAKRLPQGKKTWTFCGTPEYVAPEIILNKGHDLSADYWALGIYMCELLLGRPPFQASDPMKTYTLILKGVDALDIPNRRIGKTVTTLVKKLCRDNPAERLGCQAGGVEDIRKHRWFVGLDWDSIRTRSMKPPHVPKVSGPLDANNFDQYPPDHDLPPDEVSGWDEGF